MLLLCCFSRRAAARQTMTQWSLYSPNGAQDDRTDGLYLNPLWRDSSATSLTPQSCAMNTTSKSAHLGIFARVKESKRVQEG